MSSPSPNYHPSNVSSRVPSPLTVPAPLARSAAFETSPLLGTAPSRHVPNVIKETGSDVERTAGGDRESVRTPGVMTPIQSGTPIGGLETTNAKSTTWNIVLSDFGMWFFPCWLSGQQRKRSIRKLVKQRSRYYIPVRAPNTYESPPTFRQLKTPIPTYRCWNGCQIISYHREGRHTLARSDTQPLNTTLFFPQISRRSRVGNYREHRAFYHRADPSQVLTIGLCFIRWHALSYLKYVTRHYSIATERLTYIHLSGNVVREWSSPPGTRSRPILRRSASSSIQYSRDLSVCSSLLSLATNIFSRV
jgi:hypothetical protein